MEHSEKARLAIVAHHIFDGVRMRGAGAVIVEKDRILGFDGPGVSGSDVERLELDEGFILSPGFVDCQVNGGGGALLNDEPMLATIARIAATHRAFGTTTLLPTLITDVRERMERLAEADFREVPGVAGLHLEGPFINLERRGAHPAQHVRELAPTDMELFAAFAASGICLLTLAPERVPPGAIAALREAGVIVSLGHSNATASCAREAADEGARCVTHLFNAMSQIAPREPGLVGACLMDERLFAGIIADGLHVAWGNLDLALRVMGADRLMLVSDAMPSVGAQTTSFDLMGRRVRLRDGRLSLDDGTLAGAHLTMAEAVKRMATLAGAPLTDALRMATATPARMIGLAEEVGVLRPGAFADIVALDPGLDVRCVWLRGRPIACARLREPH